MIDYTNLIEIPIDEEFNDSQGRWIDYDVYDDAVRQQVLAQSHVDVRSFRQNDITAPRTLFSLDGVTMTTLDSDTMTVLESNVPIVKSEQWTAYGNTSFSAGPNAARANQRNLVIHLQAPPNNNRVTSTTVNAQGQIVPIDITTGYANNDLLSIALPAFPLGSITAASSRILLSSDPAGNINNGYAVYFNQSTTTLAAGDSELTIPLSVLRAIAGLDLTKITAVGFDMTTTAGGVDMTVAAMRILPTGWKYFPLSQDTRYGYLRSTSSRNGSLTAQPDYQMPIMWRAATPPGDPDPRPINGSVAVAFNTGSLQQTNSFTLYFRETTNPFMNQQTLDNNVTQATLDAYGQQPDIDRLTSGIQAYNERTQSEIENIVSGVSTTTQDELGGKSQLELEDQPNPATSSYLQFTLRWAPGQGTITLQNSSGEGYTLSGQFSLTANTPYLFVVRLEDTSARVTIYNLDGAGNISTTVYDSLEIVDDYVFKRRRGRFGWTAQIGDNDAYIDSIRSRGLEFGEQRTLPFQSFTPVIGAELFAECSPDRQLALGVDAYGGSTTISFDHNRTLSGESYMVQITQPAANQGLVTNLMQLSNFGETDMEFDLYLPGNAAAAGASLQLFLTNDNGRVIPLSIGSVVTDQWTHYKVPLALTLAQTGFYRLGIVNTTNLQMTFWIDNLRVAEDVISWAGRAVADDPWGTTNSQWIEFRDNYNRENSGVMFPQRGTELQIRAKALRQNAYIGKHTIRPRYAQLGRLTFDPPLNKSAPTAAFTTATGAAPHSLIFTGTTSSSPNSNIVMWQWDFGDGTIDFGPVATHAYPAAGNYNAALTVTDRYGLKAQTTTQVAV